MASHPAIITPALLSSLRAHPNLPAHTWYFIAAVTLSQLNRPDEIPKVYLHALRTTPDGLTPSHDEKLQISRRMREALVKAAAVGGVPRTINALLELKKATPEELLDVPEPAGPAAAGASPSPSPTGRRADLYDTPVPEVLQRGQAFFNDIYGKVARRVMSQMDNCGTEDLGLVARLMYAYVLSSTAVLSPAETSFVMIAGLVPQDVNPQLKGHLRGALNGGATLEQVRAVRSVAVDLCRAAGMRLLDPGEPGGFGWRSEPVDL
ncbi:hypothetical protein VTJ83DRAFT_3386 [Remersonia thermophila]|uniref:Carboxymuconolactone decarboxylase-like domain-containing protein n=1 Tax=Remersonia thermophila TaxID=72144 RepID=A0ABR4DE21_9PEZI